MLNDPFGRSRLPAKFDRAGRVELLGEAAQDLLDGRMPGPAAALFLAGGLLSWLDSGGDLLGDYWKVKAPAGSHRTPANLWAASSRGATDQVEADIIATRLQPEEERT